MDRSIRPKLYDPSPLREKSIIGADPDKIPGMISRPALTNDNAARGDLLPAIDFYAQAFGIRVSSVGCTSLTFCMCHVFLYKIRFALRYDLILRVRSTIPLTHKRE